MYRISCHAAIALIFLCSIIAYQPVHAEIRCESVDKIAYEKLAKYSGFDTVKSTPVDDTIKEFCKTQSWTNPLDFWHYGDFDFLFPNASYTDSEKRKAMGSRDKDYVKQIKRYSCTLDGKPLVAFHLDKAANPAGELTFLCVLENKTAGINRGAGLGFNLFNEALSTAGQTGRGDTINLKLTALPAAIPFYSSLDVDCTYYEDSKVTEYKTGLLQYTKQGGAHVERRAYSFDESWKGGKESYKTIDYGCTSKNDYDGLVKLAKAAEEEHGHKYPLANQQGNGSIKFAAVRKNICDVLTDEHYHDKNLLRDYCK